MPISPQPPETSPQEGFTPSPGKTFSTVRITVECVADVTIEHDEDLEEQALAAAVKAQLPQICDRARWWNPLSETYTKTVVYAGSTNPDELDDEPVVMDRPYELSDVQLSLDVEVVS